MKQAIVNQTRWTVYVPSQSHYVARNAIDAEAHIKSLGEILSWTQETPSKREYVVRIKGSIKFVTLEHKADARAPQYMERY